MVSAVNHVTDPQRPAASVVEIREARQEDWAQIWPVIHDVITEQQTFAYDPAMSEEDARRIWLLPAPAKGDRRGRRRPDPWCRERVREPARPWKPYRIRQARGRGAGRALTIDMIDWARRSGFAAIQFNAVVDTSTAAVLLYESVGFVTVGTAPGAFRHPVLGPVGLRLMWLDLQYPASATDLPSLTVQSLSRGHGHATGQRAPAAAR